MTKSELIKRLTDMCDKNMRYESELLNLEIIIEWLNTENNELKNTKADPEDENRHLAERVELLEHKRDELIDELKRVGNTGERDFMAGQLIAYRQVIRMILDRGKE